MVVTAVLSGLYSGVHRGSPITPGTPPFSSHPYAGTGTNILDACHIPFGISDSFALKK